MYKCIALYIRESSLKNEGQIIQLNIPIHRIFFFLTIDVILLFKLKVMIQNKTLTFREQKAEWRETGMTVCPIGNWEVRSRWFKNLVYFPLWTIWSLLLRRLLDLVLGDEMFTLYYRNRPCPHCVTSFSIGVIKEKWNLQCCYGSLAQYQNHKTEYNFYSSETTYCDGCCSWWVNCER